MADKKKAGSKLLKALGKTKKEQMKAIMPTGKSLPPGRDKYGRIKGVLMKKPSPPKIKSKGPYTRGKVMGTGDFLKRRAAISGVDATQPLRKAKKGKGIAGIVGAGAAGYAVGKGWHKKLAGAVTGDRKKTTSHKGKAKQLADKAIKKQKEKKEKHHSR